MRSYLFVCFLVLSINAFSQQGFFSTAITYHEANDLQSSTGLNFTAGASPGFNTTTGLAVDLYLTGKNKLHYAVIAADLRFFILGLNKPITPFITGQPGWIIHTSEEFGYTTKGKWAVTFLGGLRFKPKPKLPGLIISMGWSEISFRTSYSPTTPSRVSKFNGFKFQIGLSN